MLLFLVTCFSFVFLHKSLCHDHMRLFPFSLWRFPWKGCRMSAGNFAPTSSRMSLPKKATSPAEDEEVKMSILDLPELALESILERLPPAELHSMAGVCTSLRNRCSGDHLWERHLNQKWGALMGPAAHREWLWHAASKDSAAAERGRRRLLSKLVSRVWPLSWITVMLNPGRNRREDRNSAPANIDSIKSWYLALESGSFCFPAQVYNRENGHVGFMLSCYDAEVRYDPHADSFHARYPPHGRRAVAVESGVPWERLRAPPVDASPHDLHISECLHDLRPGDHVEIQWRRNKEYPYGWWYGVVGHLESCDGSENQCSCHCSDSVVLQFDQYTPGSRWRRATVDRREHREEGNEANGFYGGIRKLRSGDEISTWKRLWPTEILQ